MGWFNHQLDITTMTAKILDSNKASIVDKSQEPYLDPKGSCYQAFLVGGFKCFFVHPYLGKIPILTNISDGLVQPPTSFCCCAWDKQR